jgi:hypothetical protein
MKQDFPPLNLREPRIEPRRPMKSRPIPLKAEVIQRRQMIARELRTRVEPISERLRQLSPEERKAVFVKLEHERPIQLSGTGLKALGEPDEHITLAIPRDGNLAKLEAQISAFGTGALNKYDQPPSSFVASLQNVELGDPLDRLSDEMYARYKRDIKKKTVIYEVELVSFAPGSKQRRAELAAIRAELVKFLGYNGALFEHEERGASCHAVLRTTGVQLQALVEEARWQTKIIGFDARPQFETYSTVLSDFNAADAGILAPDSDAPVVCVIDSGVSPDNPFLKPVTRDDLLRSFLKGKPNNPFDEYGHGSGVASLVAYYVLQLAKGALNEGRVVVASARVLDENNQAEEDKLFSAALREVVEAFAGIGVKIFNLSVNNLQYRWSSETRRTVHRRSWIARTIDQLSREYDVVFVVSTGNLFLNQLQQFSEERKDYPSYLLSTDAKLLDPAQSALAVTVGSIAPKPRVVGPSGTVSAIAALNGPSPFTRCGPGVAREIKPELVDYGGNFIFDTDDHRIKENFGTSIPVASNQLTPALSHRVGSSFAAARVSHKLALVQRDLTELLGRTPSACLMKAFLISSATRRDESTECDDLEWVNTLGYGMPDAAKATDAGMHSVVMFFDGQLPVDRVAYFAVPVPASLAAANGRFRMTVTVVHAPEVQRHGLETYLGTTVRWKLFRGDTAPDDIVNTMSVDEDGEDLGEATGEKPADLRQFSLGANRRSRGAVQHDIMEWPRHIEKHSEHSYTLAVAVFKKWNRANFPDVPFAVVVRLEDLGQTAEVNLYVDVRDLLVESEVRV